jgi:hypothetical protein
MGDERSKRSWEQFLGWGVGAAIGAGGTAAAINAVPVGLAVRTGAAAVTGGVIGVVGGFVGGAAGYALSYCWDQPRIRWNFKTAALFGIVFSTLITAVLGFASLSFIAARPDTHHVYTIVVAAIAGFVSSGLSAVINNLRLND